MCNFFVTEHQTKRFIVLFKLNASTTDLNADKSMLQSIAAKLELHSDGFELSDGSLLNESELARESSERPLTLVS